ncbi:DUF3870 domain-containing protein [Brevibacillus sp. SYP-B805]|uniref:DUF3870 domain-containing protein n=1 Tax=Brevibacillus sp. SYP-B805 TaxID=1578199 RepID=UPI0013EA41C0|nr:DUF3870 domain-containing protein [Brevibacillus sp. SYP-B805]NGQ96125.1 DUF3870 domain-containing protein [Brevibacillus sp. SYP-B805]
MDWKSNPSCVLVAGFAQLPKGTTLYETYKTIGCVLIIDKENDRIVDASFTFIMGITNEFISSLVKGKSVHNGIDAIIEEIEKRFYVPPQKAVIQSVRAAYNRYCEMTKYS